MARYIDADRLKEKKYYDVKRHEYCVSIAEVDWQPTADVQEVKYGEWIDERLDKFRKWKSTCSVCGWYGVSNYDSYVDVYDFNYCPMCGAKMDKE